MNFLAIDWMSFFYGFAVAFLLSNLISLGVAYYNRAKTRGQLKSVEQDISKLKEHLLKEQEDIKKRIKEQREKK